MKIILDTAHRVAKKVFLALGIKIVIINDTPNGKNINVRLD